MSVSNIVCVAIDETYTDNNGPQTEFIFFNPTTEEFTSEYANGYTKYSFDSFSIDATFAQRLQASKAHKAQSKVLDWEVNLIDCVVILQRSRKAPNKTPLKVVSFQDRYYNGRYYTNQTVSLINETTGETFYNISTSCIKEVLQGVKKDLFWYVTEEDRAESEEQQEEEKEEVVIDTNLYNNVDLSVLEGKVNPLTIKIMENLDLTDIKEARATIKKNIIIKDLYLECLSVLIGIKCGNILEFI